MVMRMVGSGEKPSDDDAEEIIRNVASAAIDGTLSRDRSAVSPYSTPFHPYRRLRHGEPQHLGATTTS